MKLRNLTIRTKLTIAFAAMAAIVLLTSVLALNSLARADDRFAKYLDGVHRRERMATEVKDAATRRAIAARNLVLVRLPADRATERTDLERAHAETVSAIASLKDMIARATDASPRDHDLFAVIESIEARYSPVAMGIAALAAADRRDEAIDRMNEECRPLLASLLKATGDFLAHEQAQAQKVVELVESESAHDRRVTATVSACALIAAAALGWGLGNAVTGPLRRALALAEAVAAGDLGTTIVVDRRDETGQLLGALQRMNGSLCGMISRVRRSADSIATASSEIAHGNLDLSNRTELQASAVQQTAASMQQMMSRVQRSAAITREASTLAVAAANVATRGGNVVERVVATMADITASSRRIADITGVIDGIAFQTNILSLNAAVEAARAGEHGRGFSIVATEVRHLAQRSAEAAKEIRTLVQRGVETVATGNELVSVAGSTIRDVMQQVGGMADLMSQLSSSACEQSDEITQVNEAVASIDHGTQSNAALVEEGAAAAESLRLQAADLMQAIAVFHVNHATVATAAV